jgi:outer membrane protein TolC
MSLSIAKDELANTQKSYEITQNKVDAGLAAKEELYQAELNYATSKSALETAELNLENAKDQFKQYIGMDIMEDITVMTNVEVTPVEVDLKKAIDYGIKSRMELRQREISIETSQFDLITTSAMNEFKGSMDLSIGITGDNEKLKNIYKNPTNNPKVAVSFNVPLWDWGEKRARIKAQEAVIETQKLNFEEEKSKLSSISVRFTGACKVWSTRLTLPNKRKKCPVDLRN